MKKYLIPSLMLTVILLLIVLHFLVNTNEEEKYLYNGTYQQLITNYLGDDVYSNQEEKITLDNGILFYEKKVTYKNEEENINISKKYDYEEEDGYIIVENKKYQIKDNKICLDSSCTANYSKDDKEKKISLDDVTINNALIEIDSLESIKKQEDLTFVVIVQTGCIHCERFENVLKSIIYDYDIKFNILNIRKVTEEIKNEVINDYNVKATPTILMFKGGKVVDRVDTSLSKQALAELLTEKGIKNH